MLIANKVLRFLVGLPGILFVATSVMAWTDIT